MEREYISIIVAIVSWIFTFILTTRKVKTEIENKKMDLYSNFAKILLEKRIEKYPSLWTIVSSIYWVKKIWWLEDKAIAKSINLEQRKKLQEWRKENWVFLSNVLREIEFIDIKWEKHKIITSSLKSLQWLERALYIKPKYDIYDKNKQYKIDKFRNILLLSIRFDLDIIEDSWENIKMNLLNK